MINVVKYTFRLKLSVLRQVFKGTFLFVLAWLVKELIKDP